jgi:hypothetical protein
VNSVDYLLKPIEPGGSTALGKIERSAQPQPASARWRANSSGLAPAGSSNASRRASASGFTVLDGAINHFFSKDKLTLPSSTATSTSSLHTDRSRDAARPAPLRQVHRATIINIALVELFPAVDGGVVARLKDEKKTEVSVTRDRVRG